MHDVQALISKVETLRQCTEGLLEAVVCPLNQGFGLLPITNSLIKELNALTPDASKLPNSPLPELPQGVHALALRISKVAPVAYISTFYFGGQGGQDAVTWIKGPLWFTPKVKVHEGLEWPNSPISRALRKMGVSAESGKDEFDTIGLGRYRETDRWAKAYAGA